MQPNPNLRTIRLKLNDDLRKIFKGTDSQKKQYIHHAFRWMFPKSIGSRIRIERKFKDKISEGVRKNQDSVDIVVWKQELDEFKSRNSPITLGEWVNQTIREATWSFQSPSISYF